MRMGKARGIGTPPRHRRWVGFLSRDSTNPDTRAPRPVGHRRATPTACNDSRRVTGTTKWSRHEYRQWRPHSCRRGTRKKRRPSPGTKPSPVLLHQVWQQRRRDQIPRGNTDNTEEKDPKGPPPERTQTAQRRALTRTRERRQDLDGEQDGAARAVAGAKRTRRKQTKKRDEIVTPGQNRGGYLRKDSRPKARNPKYGEAGASPVRGISTGLSPCQLQ